MKIRKAQKRGPLRTPKPGRAFEEAVATVARALSPNATVTQGRWIEGPDGRRDQDVLIETSVDGKSFRTTIECKDYDKSKTGPVGISVVDALDSKRRDLECDLALICSNAGFTEPAMRKASRVGIVLVGVFREGDMRIRCQVSEYFYFRRLKNEHLGFRLERNVDGNVSECPDPLSAHFREAPVANWVCNHFVRLIMENPIGACHLAGTLRFKHPVAFVLEGGVTFEATSLFAELVLSGGWFEQLGSIDGTNGLYDFTRRRAKAGADPYKIHFKGLDLTKGTPVDHPPLQDLDVRHGTAPDEAWMQLLYLIDCNCQMPTPPLDDFIVKEDLDLMISGLPAELTLSPATRTGERVWFASRNPRVGPDHSFTIAYPGIVT